MTDRVLRDLVLGSPADRRNGDFAVLLHLAALAEPVPGPDDPGLAWLALRPVTGERVSRAAIASAVFGDGRKPMAQLVGQCLLRLRGTGSKRAGAYDPPLLAAVDRHGRPLPPDAAAGRDGYHGYLPLRVLGAPAARPPRRFLGAAEPLDIEDGQSGGVNFNPPEKLLAGHSGGVNSNPRKERREEGPPEADNREPGTPVTTDPPLRSGSVRKTDLSPALAREARPGSSSTGSGGSARPYPEFNAPPGTVEGSRVWNVHAAVLAANTALTAAGIASQTVERKAVFHAWRVACEHVLNATDGPGAEALARALTVLLLQEGPGDVRGPDGPGTGERIASVSRALASVADGRAAPDLVDPGDGAASRASKAIDRWRQKNPPLPLIDTPGPPPF